MRKAITATKTKRIVVRRKAAIELYLAGHSMRQIATQLDCGRATIQNDLADELANYTQETREMLQAQKREEFAELKLLLLPRVKNGDDNAIQLYLKTLSQESRCFGIESASSDSVGLQANQIVMVHSQYADLVKPLIEAQERG